MPKALFVDFKAVKAAVSMEQVLQQYNLLDQFKRGGDSLSGPCPIHKGTNPTQFRVSISKNVWNCFSECKHGGNVLDFIARMEGVSIHAAALKAINWFHLDPHATSTSSGEENAEQNGNGEAPSARKPEKSAEDPEKLVPNKPLKFRLEKLEREHSYLIERGLTLETIIDFGIGYCSKGMMAGRIAIPIHNVEGEVVAYAGRFLGDPPEGTPKYKLPQGFRKSLELYNIDRAIKEAPDLPLVVVEGFFHQKIKGFFSEPEQLNTHLRQSEQTLKEKEALIAVHEQTIQKIRDEMKQTHRLYVEGHITAQGFGEFYKPAEERLNQLTAELPRLQGEVDTMKINQISLEDVFSEADTLYNRWPALAIDDRRKIAETLCEKITIGDGKIRITFTGAPSSGELCKNLTRL